MKYIFVITIIICLSISGCTEVEDEFILEERIDDMQTEGLIDLLAKFYDYGYDTKLRTSVESEMLGTQRNITIDGEKIVIFEYNTEEDASYEASNIGEGGYSYTQYHGDGKFSTKNISWLTTPRYYLYKNLVIRYVGEDVAISKMLNEICGMKFN